jgi:hypothetical protein
MRVRAYNGIAFNARELKHYQEAEATYPRTCLVPARAHFHFQLGMHYRSGRPLKSAEHLQAAARIDRELRGKRRDRVATQSRNAGLWHPSNVALLGDH